MNNHRIDSIGLAGLAGIALLQHGCSEVSFKEKPNIVILLADDMGWGDLSINGNRMVETPALDRLSAQSLSFDRFYVCPLSAPTRAEMLTGRYFLRTGVSSVDSGFENMRTDEETLAEVLKDNGYATGCFGKWHNGGYYQQHPNRQGFDEFIGFCVGHLGYYFDAFFLHNDGEVKSSGYATDYFTDQALDFIDKNKDKPFLCFVPYNVPHSPFQVPEKYFNKYHSRGSDSTLSSVYGMVENMDENINRILHKLVELSLTKNTIVIFFSDNGPNTERYNGGMKGRKGSVDEGGIRVPFYISWPGKIKSGISSQLTQDVDILPTLLGLCNIDYTFVKPIDGIDLTDIILGKKALFDRYIFSRQAYKQIENCNSSVRNDRYRLVLTVTDTFLYDMQNDPWQKTDISGTDTEATSLLLSELEKINHKLISGHQPVTIIKAGLPEEKKFTLPVQDAYLSGEISFSSIYPNQSHTEKWIHNGDSVFWTLNIQSPGKYRAEMQYGCPQGETGSKMMLTSGSGSILFSIDKPFESKVLPERDYVKRGESVERTWTWMNIGNVDFETGNETIILKLIEKKRHEAGLVKAIRFTRL